MLTTPLKRAIPQAGMSQASAHQLRCGVVGQGRGRQVPTPPGGGTETVAQDAEPVPSRRLPTDFHVADRRSGDQLSAVPEFTDSPPEQEGFEPSVPPYFLKKRNCLLREAMSPSPRCNPAGAPADEELEAAWASHRRDETHWRRGAGFEPPVPS